jgi:hypothetical protein
MRRFIERTNDRRLAADFAGDVLVWDIDKTYLDTHFSSWRGLLSIPLEFAVDKESVPGAAPLLRALRRGAGEQSALTPLYFVSGSPPQLRSVIERKMLLDGVDFDGITFKDQWGLFKAGRPKDIKEQVGYKLLALLLYYQEVPPGARWFLFGDDTETDAFAFSLFGEVIAGLRGEALDKKLRGFKVARDRRADIISLAEPLAVRANPVAGIFILLAGNTPPERFSELPVTACRSFLQAALALADLGKIRPETISSIASELRQRGTPEADIESQLDDAASRLAARPELVRLARR